MSYVEDMEYEDVTLTLQKAPDGYWLEFTCSKGMHAIVHVGNTFPRDTIVHRCVRQWAEDQFK